MEAFIRRVTFDRAVHRCVKNEFSYVGTTTLLLFSVISSNNDSRKRKNMTQVILTSTSEKKSFGRKSIRHKNKTTGNKFRTILFSSKIQAKINHTLSVFFNPPRSSVCFLRSELRKNEECCFFAKVNDEFFSLYLHFSTSFLPGEYLEQHS